MSEILLREQLPAMERWQLQDMASAGKVQAGGARKASPVTGMHSAAELEALQKQAWDEAYARGLEAGRAAGKSEIERQATRLEQLLHAMAPWRWPGKSFDGNSSPIPRM